MLRGVLRYLLQGDLKVDPSLLFLTSLTQLISYVFLIPKSLHMSVIAAEAASSMTLLQLLELPFNLVPNKLHLTPES